MFFTIELVFTILMLAAEKTKATFIAPVGIGLALFVAELVGVYYTGGSLNPARAFGPAIVGSAFDTYHWIYWIGPLLGALVASGFYGIFKFLNYEEVNGDQDKTEEEQEQERKKQRRHPRSSAQRDRDAELGHADSNDVRVENGYGKHDSRASGDGRKGAGAEAVGGSYHLRTDRERERERERRGSSAHTHATLAAVRSGSTAPGHYYTQSSHPQRGERRSAGDGNAIPNPSPRHPQQFRS
ncbi:MIP family channel protein [Phlyctema vagabunda]|uniref:MIP family channel protein n=1 Tax=Phlyctema vagabunda TaxID=108571 RepID=A0ABR4P447_9HELO